MIGILELPGLLYLLPHYTVIRFAEGGSLLHPPLSFPLSLQEQVSGPTEREVFRHAPPDRMNILLTDNEVCNQIRQARNGDKYPDARLDPDHDDHDSY